LPPVIQSVVDLTNNFQNYYNIAINKINELPEDSILKSEISKNILDEIQNFDLKEIINVETITQYLQKVVGMLGGVFDIFVSIVVSIYILNSRSQIIRFLKRLAGAIFNTKSYENINKYFNRTNEIFFKFLASQMIDAVVVGVLTSIAMTIMGVKYSVLLGFMIGLFNIIPYFGAIVAVIIAGMLTFFTGGIGQTILMLVVVTILQQIDANIINPKIVGDSLKISPLLVIFAVTLGGAYFGVLGMFLAVPVIAVLKLIIDDFIDLKNNIKEK
jgi:predicted PurR-regulated permease PerM